MVVAEPRHASGLDWPRMRREAGERGAIISLLEASESGVKWLVPAGPANSAASSASIRSGGGTATVGSGAAVIDKLFEAQALVPTIKETEIRLYGGALLETELANTLEAEATILLTVSEKGGFRAGQSFDAASEGKSEQVRIRASRRQDSDRPTLHLLSRGTHWRLTQLPEAVASLNPLVLHNEPVSGWHRYDGWSSANSLNALDRDGRLWNIADEQLRARAPRQLIDGLPALRDIALTPWGGYGIDLSGSVWSWGSGTQSRLGRRGQRDAPHPFKTGVEDAARVFAADFTGYVIKRDGQVYSWGSNDHFALGRRLPSTWTHRASVVPEISDTVEIMPWKISQAGKWARGVLARTRSGQVYAWGETPHTSSWWSDAKYMAPRQLQKSREHHIVRVGCDGEAILGISDDGRLFRWAGIDSPPEHIYANRRWLQFDGRFGLDSEGKVWGINENDKVLELVTQVRPGSECEIVCSNDKRIWILQRKST